MEWNADKILTSINEEVAKGKIIDKDRWLNLAFSLNTFLYDESSKLYGMKQKVAKMKHEILKTQEKKNVALADAEIEATDEYRDARIQEARVAQIMEFIRIAKKLGDLI